MDFGGDSGLQADDWYTVIFHYNLYASYLVNTLQVLPKLDLFSFSFRDSDMLSGCSFTSATDGRTCKSARTCVGVGNHYAQPARSRTFL